MRSLVPATATQPYACVAAPVCGVAAGTSTDFNLGGWASAGSDYRVTGTADTYVYRTGLFSKYNYAALLARVRSAVNPTTVASPTTISISDATAPWTWVTGGSGVTISGGVTTAKVVILVDGPGQVNISGDITVGTWSTGNVVIISGGDISLGAGVARLDGIYMTDGRFITGSGNQLTVNGSVTAWSDLTLSRNAANNRTDPAEIFNFVPDFVVGLPEPVKRRHIVQELENP